MDDLNFVFPDPPGHLSGLDDSNQSCPLNLYKTPGRGHQVPSYPQFYPMDHSANVIPPAMHGSQLDPNLAYLQNLFNNIDPYMFASLSDPAFYPPLPSLHHFLEQRDTEDTSMFQNSVIQHDTPSMPSLHSMHNESASDDSLSNSEDRTHHSSTHQNLLDAHDIPPDIPPVSRNESTSNTDNRHETTQDTGTIVRGCASEMVPEANNLLWAARNPSRPVLVPRAPLNVMQKGHSNVQRASRKISAQQRKEAEDALHMAIQKALSEHEEKTNHLAIEHGITVEKVKKLMGGERHYKGNQNAQLANALVHAKAQEVNADQPRCTKYSLNKICEMVKDDEDMQNLNHVDRREYIQKLNEHRVLQHMSIHATNTVAAHNVQSTLDTIFKMLDNLAVRTGIYACLFASCGHVYDTAEATWFRTDNIMDFWEDVVQMEADEITQKLEQWACMTGRSLDERKTVQNMQCVCTRLLNSGLRTIVKRRDIHINYTNFDTAIKEKLGINLRGWPEDMAFQSPTSINDLNALLKLRNSLKDSSCRWFHMSPHQREEYNLQLTACRKKGEVIGKPWKKCSDAGVPRKCKGKENKCQSKRVRGSGSSVQAPKSAEFVDSSDEEYTSEDEA